MLYRLFANRKLSYCVAQCPGAKLRKWARHLVNASVYSREYNKDLILMLIMSQLRTALIFFVFTLFESLTLIKPLLLDISCGNILALSMATASLPALFRKKCSKKSVFYVKTVKIRWRLGVQPPDPLGLRRLGVSPPGPRLWPPFSQILGAPLILHNIFAYYSRVDGTEMKDFN